MKRILIIILVLITGAAGFDHYRLTRQYNDLWDIKRNAESEVSSLRNQLEDERRTRANVVKTSDGEEKLSKFEEAMVLDVLMESKTLDQFTRALQNYKPSIFYVQAPFYTSEEDQQFVIDHLLSRINKSR